MDMIYPSIEELTNEKVNRYALVIATAKCARNITDEYVRQKRVAENQITGNKETDKSLASMISKELCDEKAVRIAINRIKDGEYTILGDGVTAPVVEEVAEIADTAEEADAE